MRLTIRRNDYLNRHKIVDGQGIYWLTRWFLLTSGAYDIFTL